MSASRVAIVGGGITGLTAGFRLAAARARGVPVEPLVLEAGERPGGHATTLYDHDFVVEFGPNGFLHRPREPQVMELARDAGIEDRIVEASEASKNRFVLYRGRLHRAPDSPGALLTSGLLSPGGKLRVLLEPWARPAPDGVEESVYDFASRRIGHEAADVLVDAAVAGISAGESRRLSIAHAFPIMHEMEREHGGLIRAAIARRREGRSRLLSFDRGMRTLVDALAARLGPAVRTQAPVRSIERAPAGWRIALESGEVIEAGHVVLAAPAWRAEQIVRPLDEALATALKGISYAGIAVVAMAFRSEDAGPLDGYGYLVARAENRDAMGVLWEASIFPGRAPNGMKLLRVMLGGARRPDLARESDDEVAARARAELAKTIGIRAEPVRTWVKRWPRGIAQYELGHGERVANLRTLAARHGHLELCGTSYDGVSFGAAVRSGDAAAARILTMFQPQSTVHHPQPGAEALAASGSTR